MAAAAVSSTTPLKKRKAANPDSKEDAELPINVKTPELGLHTTKKELSELSVTDLIEFTKKVDAVHRLCHSFDKKLKSIQLVREIKGALEWYPFLDELKLDGVPEGEIKRNVDAILAMTTLVSGEHGVNEHASNHYVDGWRRTVLVGSMTVEGSCLIEEVEAAGHYHYDDMEIKIPGVRKVTLSGIREHLKMPHLPLSILLDLLLRIAFDDDGDIHCAHTFECYGLAECDVDWSEPVIKQWTPHQFDALGGLCFDHYDETDEDGPAVLMPAESIVAKFEHWRVLKSKSPHPLTFPDPVWGSYMKKHKKDPKKASEWFCALK